jgi:hypothetical protein
VPASASTASASGSSGQLVFERATDATPDWPIYETPLGETGQPYRGMQPNRLSARITARGGGLLVGEDSTRKPGNRVVALVRNPGPGGRFQIVPEPPVGGVLANPPTGVLMAGGEGGEAAPEVIATDEGSRAVVDAAVENGARTEVFFGVLGRARDEAVARWNGESWTREPIELPPGYAGAFTIVGIAGTSPQNMWLLGQASPESGLGIMLFKRVKSGSGQFEWTPVELGPTRSQGRLFAVAQTHAAGVEIEDVAPLGGEAQPLTVSKQGVWIDGNLHAAGGGSDGYDFTLYYDIPAGEVTEIPHGEVTGSWCDADRTDGTKLCDHRLHARFGRLAGYRSFAYENGSQFGGRIVTNPLLPGRDDSTNLGTYLKLEGTSFERMPGAGTNNAPGGAFYSENDGWLEGPVQITSDPAPQHLVGWPVSARAPFTAIAPAPGTTPGDPSAQALAVGSDGVVARYTPGQGWQREFLLTGSGAVSSPNLRAVAWPEPGRAFAVGDLGAMWIWRAETNLWEKDPAAPPAGTQADLLGIAFDPSDPARGYAVGLGGVLWRYDKTWTQEPLPEPFQKESEGDPEEQIKANFTGVAFAGSEAMVVAEHYKPSQTSSEPESSALLVNSGSGWTVEPQVTALLDSLPERPKLYTVAGLPDGGAVLAGRDVVLERNSASSPWHFSAQPIVNETAVAAAAYDEGSTVRAVLSVVPEITYPPVLILPTEEPNVPPTLIPPNPLPGDGYLLRETPSGWQDEERADYAGDTSDKPVKVDPILALDLGPEGAGWAVGGWSGYADNAGRGTDANGSGQSTRESVQTAAIDRYAPAGGVPGPPASAQTPIPLQAGVATFAVAGHAECVEACADLADVGIGPDRNLTGALSTLGALASRPNGPRMLLYTGGRETPGQGPESEAEADRFRDLLAGTGGIATYPALSAGDSEGEEDGAFAQAFAAFAAPFGEGPLPVGVSPVTVPGTVPARPGARTHYAFDSEGPAGTVRVIVIDNSRGSLALSNPYQNPPEEQGPWLEKALEGAKHEGIPAIVMGSRELNPSLPPALNVASDAAHEAEIMLKGGASAYLYERPEETRSSRIPVGASTTIPEYGTGTLGYRSSVSDSFTPGQPDALFGTAGYLLFSVDVAQRNPVTNVAPVSARLIPLVQSISLDPVDGTLLRRSAPALFLGLGRRPVAGDDWGPISAANESPSPPGTDPYTVFPQELCLQSDCPTRIEPEYTFTSSETEIADFVEQDPESTNLRKPLQNAAGHVIPDPQSGILCAFNPGTTVVTVSAGGLSYSVPVTVLGGSVQQPCGTVPLSPSRFKRPASASQATPASPPPPAPTPAPAPVAPVPPPPPAVPATPRPAVTPPALPFASPAPALPTAAALVTPLPPPASGFGRPVPPGGATVRVFEEEREEEAAPEQSQAFARYEAAPYVAVNGGGGGHGLASYALVAAIVLAGAGTSIRMGRRRQVPGPRRSRRAPLAVARAAERHRYQPPRR